MIGRRQIGYHLADNWVIPMEMKRRPRQYTFVLFRHKILEYFRIQRLESYKVEVHVHSSALVQS